MEEAEALPVPEALTTGCALLFLAVTNTCFRLLEPDEEEAGVTTTVVADFEDTIDAGNVAAPLEDWRTRTTLAED